MPVLSLTANGRCEPATHLSTSLLYNAHRETKGAGVEVKIGVADSARELVINSAQTPDEVEKLVAAALGKDAGLLSLADDKGRRYLVQAAKIAYVQIGIADSRRVGFGIGSDAATGASSA